MIRNYGKIIKQLKDEIFSFVDEFKDENFNFDGDFIGFKFKTDDNLVYNKRINIPVCVILLSNVIGKQHDYHPVLKLQRCLYEKESF